MREQTQKLLPLSYDRKGYRQIATDHCVHAAHAVNGMLDIIESNGNIDSIEFDCEISPKWAIRVISKRVYLEELDYETDDLINTELFLADKSLMTYLEELCVTDMAEQAKTNHFERME
jgi:hypothetical protein